MDTPLDRATALAICFANLKGSRDKDLITTAKALRYLRDQSDFNSNAKLGAQVQVSGEIVREFLALLKLPIEIQAMLDKRVLNLEQGRRLSQVQRHRPDLLADVAGAMVGMGAIDSRNLAEYILVHPELTVEQAKQAILDSKSHISREYHVIALLDERQFNQLTRLARDRRTTVNDLVTETVKEWLGGFANGK